MIGDGKTSSGALAARELSSWSCDVSRNVGKWRLGDTTEVAR
jgi:hypothetical protein